LVQRLLSEHRIGAFLHLAATTHVDRPILGPQAFVRTNLLGTPLPLTRCDIVGRTLADQPGQASAVLTKHYLRMHPEALSEAAEATGS
jgi:dTDP-D-glucose 4,6-dehydratase